MLDIVDLLASEYGWDKDYIYEKMYFDEVYMLMQTITKRRNGHYKMLLAIAQNPHNKDPKLLWNALDALDRPATAEEELDTAGFERLKLTTSQNPRIIVK